MSERMGGWREGWKDEGRYRGAEGWRDRGVQEW